MTKWTAWYSLHPQKIPKRTLWTKEVLARPHPSVKSKLNRRKQKLACLEKTMTQVRSMGARNQVSTTIMLPSRVYLAAARALMSFQVTDVAHQPTSRHSKRSRGKKRAIRTKRLLIVTRLQCAPKSDLATHQRHSGTWLLRRSSMLWILYSHGKYLVHRNAIIIERLHLLGWQGYLRILKRVEQQQRLQVRQST